jgi:transposase-like protein
VRLQRIPDVSAASLVPFVCDVVEPGMTVQTDGWASYNAIADYGYAHEKTVLRTSGVPAHVSMPGAHRVASLLKRWLLGTHQEAVSPDHLDAYLNEFTFRFNRRASRRRGQLFYRLLEPTRASAFLCRWLMGRSGSRCPKWILNARSAFVQPRVRVHWGTAFWIAR